MSTCAHQFQQKELNVRRWSFCIMQIALHFVTICLARSDVSFLFGVDVLNTLKKVDWKPIVRRSVHSPFFKHWEWISTTRTVMSHFGVWYFKHVKKKLWWETHYGKECIFPVFKHWEWIFNNNKIDISFWCWHLNTLKKLGRKPTMGRSLHSPFLSI